MTQRILSIETATEFCSIALTQGEEIITRSVGVPSQHSLSVLPLIEEILAEAQISLKMLDAIAVGQGPGSFTGVRLGISVAQGLCFGLNIQCIPVSTLKILAYGAKTDALRLGATCIMAAMDARMGEIYGAVYEIQEGKLTCVIDHFVQKPNEIQLQTYNPSFKTDQSVIAIGSGWQVYPNELLQSMGMNPILTLPTATPQASDLAQLAIIEFKEGKACEPELCLPAYCRDKVVF